jgi:hypothetical protein
MATTDTRTGFRLPWSTDRTASREASAETAEELAAGAPASDVADGAPTAPEPVEASPQDAAGDGVQGQEDAPVTILAPDTAPVHAQADPPAPAYEHAESPDLGAPSGAGQRRPTKFLADLTRAMQAAAEQARAATLEQFRGEGTAVIEQIRARSTTGAAELRRHADDDVATVKEWSKVEITRIREETERRVGMRREQLEGQLERHAALVEHEVERVRGRLAAFETEMGQFFDDLAREDDPAVFAARAANLPEPPSFDDVDEDAMTALLSEPGLGVPDPATEGTVAAIAVEPEPTSEPGQVAIGEATQSEPKPTADDAPVDDEAAMAAIQAAAEAAAASETTELPAEHASEGDAEATTEARAEVETTDAGAPDVPASEQHEDQVDPRLAMLGLAPDFAAAEVEAVEMATAEVEDVPEIGGDALAARLSGLVPGEPDGAAEAAVTTQVIVTGLVSVASIASFKRHMGRLPGVSHVGVSSGPDAEFVFAVTHEPATSLRDLIPTLPGFAARIAGSGDGVIQVSAQDPQD